MKLFAVTALVLAFANPVFAADKPKEAAECTNLVKACEGAGYHGGDHKKTGKGLWHDCVKAIADGKAVEGVTATQDEAKACQAVMKTHRAEKKAAKH